MAFGLVDGDVVSCVASFLPWEPDFLLRVTLLAGGVLLAGSCLGRRRPAVRHLITSLGLGCLLLLGVLSLRMPSDSAMVRGAVLVWGTVAAALTLRLLVDLCMVSWRVARGTRPAPPHVLRRGEMLARRIGLRRPVRVLRGQDGDLPHAWGVLRPTVVMPGSVASWPAERLDAVLLHELGHLRRRDVLATLLARLAGIVYWFHPLVWWLQRRAREDAERSCDILAVEQGMPAVNYARHLLAMVRDARGRSLGLAPGMAESSDLGARIGALLAMRAGGMPPARSRVARPAALFLATALILPTVLLAREGAAPVHVIQDKGSLAACFTGSGTTDISDDLASEETSPVAPH